MYTEKWNEWVNKYGEDNVIFVCRSIDCMRTLTLRYGWDGMVESTEDALNETID